VSGTRTRTSEVVDEFAAEQAVLTACAAIRLLAALDRFALSCRGITGIRIYLDGCRAVMRGAAALDFSSFTVHTRRLRSDKYVYD